LTSDNTKDKLYKAVKQILRMYAIRDRQRELEYQNQNLAERWIQKVKKMNDAVMDRTGTPAKYWLLCLLYVVMLLNHLATQSLDWKTPIEKATGQKADISPYLAFCWREPVYYLTHEKGSFPSKSREKTGRWVVVAESKGDALTSCILTDDTKQVIYRSAVRSALDPIKPDIRAEERGQKAKKPILKSVHEIDDVAPHKLPKFSPYELIGKTFMKAMPDGGQVRAKIIRKIMDKHA